ncbi:hypothetical protein BDR06DRAFT_977789 [Suillus hirtellus]|nr:hypothetical protein BDR06DRAFT_977789 [Suillus hirtellus]
MSPQWKNTSQLATKATATTPIAASVTPSFIGAPTSTGAPIAIAPIAVAPIAVAPITAAVNANILCNPQRHHQLLLQFRQNDGDEGESFHLENISRDEKDDVINSPASAVRPAEGPYDSFQCLQSLKIHDLDVNYHVTSYIPSTSTSTHCAHTFTKHTYIHLEEVEC